MKRSKGFTLMELLAVIVILAIIVLIVTPIVTNIINSSKESANRNSVNFYGKAIDDAVKAYMAFNDGKVPSGAYYSNGKMLYTVTGDVPTNIGIDYKGSHVVCDNVIIYENGSVFVDKCKVGNNKDYVYKKGSKSDYFAYNGLAGKFAEDSWDTIISNVKKGDISGYKVGDTKIITLTGDVEGDYTVRIANISSDDTVCTTEGYSKTACGFVIEFVDIITKENMNPISTNSGGLSASKMRHYVNDTIYKALPAVLKENIIDTKVVSGHGLEQAANFTTTDKLYLLSTKEVWGTAISDTVDIETRQLDYYKNIGVTRSNYSGAAKRNRYNASDSHWWLRSADSGSSEYFMFVMNRGEYAGQSASILDGVAPAFRIG